METFRISSEECLALSDTDNSLIFNKNEVLNNRSARPMPLNTANKPPFLHTLMHYFTSFFFKFDVIFVMVVTHEASRATLKDPSTEKI